MQREPVKKMIIEMTKRNTTVEEVRRWKGKLENLPLPPVRARTDLRRQEVP
jgi:hypothetical protein